MAVNKIEIRNFLCIQDAVVHLPQGLIAIVGRNGSGKSSLLQALIWALTCEPSVPAAHVRCHDVNKAWQSFILLYHGTQIALFV